MLIRMMTSGNSKLSQGRTGNALGLLLVFAGMLFVAIGVSSLGFLNPSSGLGPDAMDGLKGLLFGLGIGVMLVGVTLLARIRRQS